MAELHCDRGSAKSVKDVAPRRHVGISLVKVKDIHLMNKNLPVPDTFG